MDSKQDRMKDLIVRSLLETISVEEQEILRQWRQENPLHEALYQRVSLTSTRNRHLQELAAIDTERAFYRNQQKLKKIARQRIIRKCLPYAAVILLCFGLIGLLPEKETPPPTGSTASIAPGSHKAELILSKGTAVRLLPDMNSHLQEGTSQVEISGGEIRYATNPNAVETLYHTIRTPVGGEYSVTLADGSVIRLNAMSEITYPVNFTGKERKVELKGEAYFSIQRDTARPFYVMASGNKIKVLGTEFNVNAYPEEPSVKTTLCRGSVCFSNPRTGKSVLLKPGEQVSYDNVSGALSVAQVNTDLYTAWTQGEFRFDNTRMDEIFGILQRWYQIEVFYANQQVKEEVFTGKLPRFDNLQTILNIMEKVSPAKFEIKGNTVLIR